MLVQFYYNHKDDSVKDLVHAVCTNTSFWGQDLTQIAGFEDAVVQTLTEIDQKYGDERMLIRGGNNE